MRGRQIRKLLDSEKLVDFVAGHRVHCAPQGNGRPAGSPAAKLISKVLIIRLFFGTFMTGAKGRNPSCTITLIRPGIVPHSQLCSGIASLKRGANAWTTVQRVAPTHVTPGRLALPSLKRTLTDVLDIGLTRA